MKIQDIIAIIIILTLLVKREPKWFLLAGIICLCIAIPLFHFWVFFTAQKLTEYAALFILLALLFSLHKDTKNK